MHDALCVVVCPNKSMVIKPRHLVFKKCLFLFWERGEAEKGLLRARDASSESIVCIQFRNWSSMLSKINEKTYRQSRSRCRHRHPRWVDILLEAKEMIDISALALGTLSKSIRDIMRWMILFLEARLLCGGVTLDLISYLRIFQPEHGVQRWRSSEKSVAAEWGTFGFLSWIIADVE